MGQLLLTLHWKWKTACWKHLQTFKHGKKLQNIKLNSVTWFQEQTIPTERSLLVGEASANFCTQRVPRGQCDGFLWLYSRLSSSSTVLTRLSGPHSRPTTSQKIW
jgi:hypothetical protein